MYFRKILLLITLCLLLVACDERESGTERSEADGSLPTPTAIETTAIETTADETTTDETTGETEIEATTDTVTETVDEANTTDLTETGEITAPMAVAILVNVDGDVVGDASFTEVNDAVEIQVSLREFDAAGAGEHGIHIHTTGACSPDFEAAGEHFNPTEAEHGLENSNGPHAGDLPNIEIDADGNALYRVANPLITLSADGEGSLLDEDGSALVLHADPDDMMTDPAGESGERIACGIIELQ